MSTTTDAALRPYSPVCWSSGVDGNALTVGTLLPITSATPGGHSPVRTPGGVLNVMTVKIRPYAPTAAEVATMREWVAECAPTEDDMGEALDRDVTPDRNIVRFVGRLHDCGHGAFTGAHLG